MAPFSIAFHGTTAINPAGACNPVRRSGHALRRADHGGSAGRRPARAAHRSPARGRPARSFTVLARVATSRRWSPTARGPCSSHPGGHLRPRRGSDRPATTQNRGSAATASGAHASRSKGNIDVGHVHRRHRWAPLHRRDHLQMAEPKLRRTPPREVAPNVAAMPLAGQARRPPGASGPPDTPPFGRHVVSRVGVLHPLAEAWTVLAGPRDPLLLLRVASDVNPHQ